jgi:hypothetical protein
MSVVVDISPILPRRAHRLMVARIGVCIVQGKNDARGTATGVYYNYYHQRK